MIPSLPPPSSGLSVPSRALYSKPISLESDILGASVSTSALLVASFLPRNPYRCLNEDFVLSHTIASLIALL